MIFLLLRGILEHWLANESNKTALVPYKGASKANSDPWGEALWGAIGGVPQAVLLSPD